MANTHGKDTYVSLGGDDLSTFANASEFNVTGDSHDVTTFGASAHVYQGGLLDGTASMGGIYDNTAATGPRAVILPIVGTVVEFVRRPEGTGASLPMDTVDVLVTSYQESSPVADMVTWQCEMQLSGPIDSTPQGA